MIHRGSYCVNRNPRRRPSMTSFPTIMVSWQEIQFVVAGAAGAVAVAGAGAGAVAGGGGGGGGGSGDGGGRRRR